MSVQVLSRIAALLALDADQLRDFIPTINADDEDINEANRAKLVQAYDSQISEQGIKDLVAAGDFNDIFQYLADHLTKPVPEGDQTDEGDEDGG